MKWIALLFTLTFGIQSYSQVKYVATKNHESKIKANNKELYSALSEFGKYASFEFRFGNGNFKAIMLYSFSKPTSEIYVMMETLEKEPENCKAVLEALWKACNNNSEQLFANLISIGLDAKYCQVLTNYIISKSSTNIPSNNTNHFFQGTKRFCEDTDTWIYELSINGSSITIKSFPGKKNTSYTKKNEAVEVITGKIVNNAIVTNDPPAYLTNRYKFKNGILYEVNNEDGYNEYYPCK